MDIETMMQAVGRAIQRMEEAAGEDATAIRELAMRVQVLEDRVAALAAHDKPSQPADVAWEADEQPPRKYDIYEWVL